MGVARGTGGMLRMKSYTAVKTVRGMNGLDGCRDWCVRGRGDGLGGVVIGRGGPWRWGNIYVGAGPFASDHRRRMASSSHF